MNKNKQAKLQRLKELLVIANDPHVKKDVKHSAFLELWKGLELPVSKIVNQTISKSYHHDRPSSDVVSDAVFESMLWIILNSKSYDPKKGAHVATYAYNKIAELTMKVVGYENVTLDIDETTEEGARHKAKLEREMREGSARGRGLGVLSEEAEVQHPFDLLAGLENQTVSLLLEALQYLLAQGLITDDAATICAERVMGTEYSIIAEYFGKTEVATRKIAERTNFQLKHLNLELPRYADLIKIPMIANVVNGKASRKSK